MLGNTQDMLLPNLLKLTVVAMGYWAKSFPVTIPQSLTDYFQSIGGIRSFASHL